MRYLTLVSTLAVLFIVAPAVATTYTVLPNGSGNFATIQAAVNGVSNGDIIELGDGTFIGTGNRDVTYEGKAITIESASGDPSTCIIDCQGSARGFWFDDGEDRDSYLRYVTIRNGSATGDGGAILIGKNGFPPFSQDKPAHPTIVGCVFENNNVTALVGGTARGGAISGILGSSPMILSCTFTDNSAGGVGNGQGGALYLYGGVIQYDPEMWSCSFINNHGGNIGGAIFLEGTDSRIAFCLFSENTSLLGGALYTYGAMMSVEYCTFSKNSSFTSGGAVYMYGSTPFTPQFENCTFYANSCSYGSAFMFHTSARANIVRTIVSDGLGGVAFDRYSAGTVTLQCCDVYGNAGGPGFVSGQIGTNNNFSAFPAYCDPLNDDLTVRDVSPCAAGNSPCGQQVGAWGVGCSGTTTYLVCPDGTGDFLTIQAGIDAALDGDTVELCDGTYTGVGNRDLDYNGKAITVRSESGNPASCIIDCQGLGRGFVFHNGEGLDSVLESITIHDGYHDWRGGGVACSTASPTLTNIIFDQNNCYNGGAMTCEVSSDPSLSGCVFTGNTALDGGGLFCGGNSAPVLNNCDFIGNSATYDAGGLWCISAMPTIQNCYFAQNTAISGGAMQIQGVSDPTIEHCTFYENGAEYGGAIAGYFLNSSIDYCTFSHNYATGTNGWGGGVYIGNNAGLAILNCTFYANWVGGPNKCGAGVYVDWDSDVMINNTIITESTDGEAVCCDVNCSATLECCDIWNNAGGDYTACIAGQNGLRGNISMNPLFCDAPNEDFTLDQSSPCAPFSPPNSQCDLIGAWPVGCGSQVDFDDHNVGNCILTMTDQGIIGFMDGTQAQGSGFVYPAAGMNHLYIGGLWVSDDDYIANRDFDSDPAREWVVSTVPDGHVVEVLGANPDQILNAGYTDNGAATPHGIYVRQESWAYANAPDDDYVIVRYFIHNNSGVMMDEMYASLFLDFDLGGTGTDDTGGIDRARSLAYMTDTSGDYVGLRLLDADQSPDRRANLTLVHNPTYIWPQNYVLDTDKIEFLKGRNRTYILEDGSTPDDYSVLISAGPFSLAPGDSNEVAFAVLGGSSLADLQANSDQAQIMFIGDPADTPDPDVAGMHEIRLLPNRPNPFNPSTVVRFQLDRSAGVKLSVYDVSGRHVKTLANGSYGGGMHSIQWNGADDAGMKVAPGVYFSLFEVGSHKESRRMLLVR